MQERQIKNRQCSSCHWCYEPKMHSALPRWAAVKKKRSKISRVRFSNYSSDVCTKFHAKKLYLAKNSHNTYSTAAGVKPYMYVAKNGCRLHLYSTSASLLQCGLWLYPRLQRRDYAIGITLLYVMVLSRVGVGGGWGVEPPAKFSTPVHLTSSAPRGSIKPPQSRILATSSFSQ